METTQTQHLAAHHANQLLAYFYAALDARNHQGVADSFHPGAVWLRQGKRLSDREQILAALQTRNPALVVHHAFSNLVIEPMTSPDQVKARYLLTVYQHVNPRHPEEAGPYIAGSPQVGFCDIRMERQADVWRFTAMAASPPTFRAG